MDRPSFEWCARCDGGLERELGFEAAFDLRCLLGLAGLEVDDGERAVLQQVDAIGCGLERHAVRRTVSKMISAFCLGHEVGAAGRAFGGPADIGCAGANPEGHFEIGSVRRPRRLR